MSRFFRSSVGVFASAIAVASLVGLVMACGSDNHPLAVRRVDAASADVSPALPLPTKSVLLARSTFSDGKSGTLDIKRDSDDWHMQVKGNPDFDIAVQTINFPAGSQSTWHTHSGPVFIQVVQGTISFYESDDPTCSPTVVSAGQGFVDMGEHAHIARNETGSPAQNVVTYFAPPGAPLKVDQPNPGNCPF